jgi:hypothetical protein
LTVGALETHTVTGSKFIEVGWEVLPGQWPAASWWGNKRNKAEKSARKK